MRYLLDADTLIDFVLDRGNARPRITAMIEQGDEVAVCAVSVAELYSGLSDKRRATWESWIMALSYWHIEIEVPCARVHIGRWHQKAAVHFQSQTHFLPR
jgi:predicted nucleic acid-binding protein